jgi:hypothetical protein
MKMKLLLLLLIPFFCISQFNSSAPWILNKEEAKDGKLTIEQLNQSFDTYWLNHDKNKKGSGYKPFMRWQYHWQNKVNDNGMLITPQQMWDAFNQKKTKASNKVNQSFTVGNWSPLGPFTHLNTGSWSSGQGRVNIVHVDPSNSSNVYIGTPAGGIWKSTDSGNTWSAMSDNLPQIGVSGIAIDYTNSNVIYIATGDKDAADSYSVGVIKSTDGGLTWNTTGLTFTNTSSRAGDILIHPTNNQMLWCATSNGLYRTINAGVSWTLITTGDFAQGSIRLKPNDPSTVYAVSNNRFFRSTNSGENFTQITTGLPNASGRLILDITPANPNYIYILSANTDYSFQGLFKSSNGGTNWTNVSGTGTNIFESSQAWFDLALAVSNTNAEEVYTGCLNVWKSTNGGANFTKINSWSQPFQASYTHADIHYLGFHGNKLYCGSDGGIYVSNNGGILFTDKTAGAQIGQFYKVSVSKQSTSNMMGGLQDNGGYAFSGGLWKNYYGADGMDTGISPVNQNLYYGFIQNGSGLYISTNAGNTLSGSVNIPNGETGNWVTPLVINSIGEVYAGFTNLYKLVGSSWQLQNTAGSLGSGNLELVTIDPSNDNIMYVTNGSSLYKSTDKGINFTLVYVASSTIRTIEVHSSNSDIVYLVTSGSSGLALKSLDGGSTFTNFSSGLPFIGKNTIVHQGRHSNNPLYIGTSLGVYYIDDTLTSWIPFDTNLPNVTVTDLEINLEDAKLIAATFGRGIWQTDIAMQIPANDIKLVQIQSPTININCTNLVAAQVQVKNNGLNPISSVNFLYTIDGVANTYNWTGSILSNQFETITLPSITLARGSHSISVTSTIINDAYSDNNSGSKNFYVNDSGTIGMVNSFTNAVDELIVYSDTNGTNNWVRGVKTGLLNSAGETIYTTNLTSNYADNTKTYLVSQCYDLTNITNPQIQFDMKYRIENNWDIVYVEYSTNLGQTWTVLGEAGPNWYNSDRTPQTTGNDCNNCVGAQWTGSSTNMSSYFYSLNALTNQQNIIFRFVFQSDQSVTQEGVNIDNFVITGILSNEQFEMNNVSIYPNPSKDIYTISLGDLVPSLIEVYDLSGKIILSKKNNLISNFETSINLTDAAQGVYFVKIVANDQQIVKRIIKK